MREEINENVTLIHGDCLQSLKSIQSQSVDLVFADLPYGKTSNKWDIPIDLKSFWNLILPIAKAQSPFVFTASSGFEFILYNSFPEAYKYKWIWNKNNSCGFATAKIRPFQITEDVLVFGKGKINYYPQMEERGNIRKKGGYSSSDNYGNLQPSVSYNNLYFPKNILNFSSANQKDKIHPTQKPLELLEYLIRTYTLPGDLVLDPVMGSGTTGIACMNTGRRFIGIEKDEEIFYSACVRCYENLSTYTRYLIINYG